MSLATANQLEAHAQALVVGSPAWERLKQEVKEGRVPEAELRQRLQGARTSGTAASPGSAAPAPQTAAKKAKGESVGETLLHLAEGPFGPGTEFEQELNKTSPSGLAGEAVSGLAGTILGWIEEAFGQELVKGLLYVALAGGGAALLIAGVSRATGAHPVQQAKKAAGLAALA